MGIPWIRLIPPCSSGRENPSGPNWCCCSGSLVRAGHWELLRPLSRGRWNSQGMEFPGDGIPGDGRSRSVSPPRLQECRYSLFSVRRHLPFQQNRENPTFLTLKPARLSLGNLPRRRVPEFQGSGMSADPAGREQSRENGIIPLPVPGPAKPFLESFIPNPSSHPAPSSRPPGTARTFPNPAWDSFSRREFRNSLRP